MASAKAGTMRRDAGQLAEGNWRGGRRRFISYAGQMNKHKNKPFPIYAFGRLSCPGRLIVAV